MHGKGKGKHTSMSTNVEKSIKLAGAGQHIGQFVRVAPERLLLVQEGRRGRVGLEHLHRGWVEGCLAALGGGDGELDLFVEDLVGVGEFGLDDCVSFSFSFHLLDKFVVPVMGVMMEYTKREGGYL